MNEADARRYASRAGLKLAHSLKTFGVDVAGFICADFGCNVGGFTDCLLQAGAARVYAIDTGYGTLDYRLRMDERIVVMERTNALHALPPSPAPPEAGRGAEGEGDNDARQSAGTQDHQSARSNKPSPHPNPLPPGEGFQGCDLVTIDLGWTPQRLAIPAALKWLTTAGQIISLIKPHYELEPSEKDELLVNGTLSPDNARRVLDRILNTFPSLNVSVEAWTTSPLTGAKSGRKAGGQGNVEYFALLHPIQPRSTRVET